MVQPVGDNMSNRHILSDQGYLVFDGAIPQDLTVELLQAIYAEDKECFNLPRLLANKYVTWLMAFIDNNDIGLVNPSADITVFNRPIGGSMYWHDDSTGGSPNARRVFTCAYLTPTFNGCGPLKIIPGTQHGSHQELRNRLNEVRAILSQQRPWRDVFEEEPDVFHKAPMEGEKFLEVPERTLVVADERLIHGVAPNQSDHTRPMVLTWLWKTNDDYQRDVREGK